MRAALLIHPNDFDKAIEFMENDRKINSNLLLNEYLHVLYLLSLHIQALNYKASLPFSLGLQGYQVFR